MARLSYAIGLLMTWLLAACSPVSTVGKRVGNEGDIRVGKLQVYSFVPMHAMGSERLRRDARGLDDALAVRLRGEKIDAVVTDVEELVRRYSLPVEVSVSDRDGTRRSTFLPVNELLTVNYAEEATVGVSHRLVLTPARLTVDRTTGIAHGVVQWRVETTTDASPVAVGLMRYTADVRGFPAKRMAGQLVAEMHKLGIR